jgi:hypothetical protein
MQNNITKKLINILLALGFILIAIIIKYSIIDKSYLEIEMTSEKPGVADIFYQNGEMVRAITIQGEKIYKFDIPNEYINEFRFDPAVEQGLIKLKKINIIKRDGNIISVPLNAVSQLFQIKEIKEIDKELIVEIQPNANDPQLLIKYNFNNGLNLFEAIYNNYHIIILALAIIFISNKILKFIKIFWNIDNSLTYIKSKINILINYRKTTILIASIISVVASSYPIVFNGKSYITPIGSSLYESRPYIPKFEFDGKFEDYRGSDVGAMNWSFAPNSVVQHNSIFVDKEFPLWDRFNSSGVPLYGQGQSMIGDPLHLLPVIFNGTALSWDVKFLSSKLIFSFGMGLLIFLLLGEIKIACAIAALSCFIGFYAWRFNHPAYFVFTYVPYIVYLWAYLAKVINSFEKYDFKKLILTITLVPLITWCQINSGAVKEGIILCLFAHIFGISLYCIKLNSEKIKSGIYLIFAIIVSTILLTAPWWYIFLATLKNSYTAYDIPNVHTYPIWEFLSFSENILFQKNRGYLVGPTINLVIFIFILYSLICKNLGKVYWLTLGLFSVSASFAFGIIPKNIVLILPFVKNIIHINNTFSVPMIFFGLILSGYGLKSYLLNNELNVLAKNLFILILLYIAIYILYQAYTPYSLINLLILIIGILFIITLFLVRVDFKSKLNKFIVVVFLCGITTLILFRNSLHEFTPIQSVNSYIVNPNQRSNLNATSESVKFIQDKYRLKDPFRVVGNDHTLYPGYSNRYLFETIVSVEALRNNRYDRLLDLIDYPKINDWLWLRIVKDKDFETHRDAINLLGIRYVVTPESKNHYLSKYYKLVHKSDLEVYENVNAWPRAYYTNQFEYIKNDDDFKNIFLASKDKIFTTVEEGYRSKNIVSQNDIQITSAGNFQVSNNKTCFDINASGPGIVVLNQSYYPDDYLLNVNDINTEYFPVNLSSIGFWVEKASTYNSCIIYRPKYISKSLYLSISGIIFLIFLALFLKKFLRYL